MELKFTREDRTEKNRKGRDPKTGRFLPKNELGWTKGHKRSPGGDRTYLREDRKPKPKTKVLDIEGNGAAYYGLGVNHLHDAWDDFFRGLSIGNILASLNRKAQFKKITRRQLYIEWQALGYPAISDESAKLVATMATLPGRIAREWRLPWHHILRAIMELYRPTREEVCGKLADLIGAGELRRLELWTPEHPKVRKYKAKKKAREG